MQSLTIITDHSKFDTEHSSLYNTNHHNAIHTQPLLDTWPFETQHMVVSQSGTYQTTMRQPIFHRPRQKTRHAQRQKSRITHSISSISKDVDEYQYSIQIIIICIPRINSTYNLRLTCRNPCYHTNIRYSKRIAATRNNKTTKTPGTQRRKHEGIEM